MIQISTIFYIFVVKVKREFARVDYLWGTYRSILTVLKKKKNLKIIQGPKFDCLLEDLGWFYILILMLNPEFALFGCIILSGGYLPFGT